MKRVVVLALALSMLTACASGSANPGPTATGTAAAGFNSASYSTVNPSDVVGGTLHIGVDSSCGVLVPQLHSPYRLSQSGTCRNLQRFLVRGLTAFVAYPGASGMEAVPDLATDLGEVSQDGLSVAYELRPGVQWQDGTPITSADVLAGLRQFDVENRNVEFRSLSAEGNRVVIGLPAPLSTIDELLAMSAAAPLPSSGLALASGPFQLRSSSRTGYTFERNAAWSASTDAVRTPHSESVTVSVNPDVEALENAVVAGELNVMLAPGLSDIEAHRVLANPNTAGDADNPATGETLMLAMQESAPPLENVACRRAVFSAVDRNAIINVTGGTAHQMPAITVSPPNYPSYAGGYEPYPIGKGDGDIAAAQAQLTTCGQGTGFTLKIAYAQRSSEVFNVLRTALQRVRITAIGVPIADAGFDAFASTPSQVEAAGVGALLFSYASTVPSVEAYLSPLVAPVTPIANTNLAKLELRSIDVLVNSAEMGSRDLAIQGDVGRAVDRLILDAVAYIPLTYGLAMHVRPRSLTNVAVNSAFASEYDAVNLGTQGSPATAAASD